MSGCVVLVPIVAAAAWPVLSGAAAAVMASVGFTAVQQAVDAANRIDEQASDRVELDLANSEEVAASLGRAEELVFEKDGLTVRFARDVRGKLKICVEGSGYDKADLKRFGEEIAGRVVQQYACTRILNEMQKNGLSLVEQTVDEENNIRIKLRGWED